MYFIATNVKKMLKKYLDVHFLLISNVFLDINLPLRRPDNGDVSLLFPRKTSVLVRTVGI